MYTFVTDNDGHWFLIRMEDREKFHSELDAGEEDDYEQFNNLFYPFRVDHPSQFAIINAEPL